MYLVWFISVNALYNWDSSTFKVVRLEVALMCVSQKESLIWQYQGEELINLQETLKECNKWDEEGNAVNKEDIIKGAATVGD